MSQRLAIAYSYVPLGSHVIDVGADKGLLSVELAKRGDVVLAVENKQGPYRALFENIQCCSLSNLSCILADGIDFLPGDINCCCLLGMGGKTIFEILNAHLDKLSQFQAIVVEPQSLAQLPIELLLHHGFVNDLGCMVFEKKYYPLLRFVPGQGKKDYSLSELRYGPYNVEHEDPRLKEYLNAQIALYETISSLSAQEKLACLKQERKEIFGI